jgi:PAS domain S-box-containing protein
MALQARRSRRAPTLETVAESDNQLISIFDAARNMIDLPLRKVSAARNGLRYREFLNALGVAVYTTDADGRITFYNEAAATFWGRRPELGEEWCGSLRLFWSDGRAMRHDECPMAIALHENRDVRGYEAIAERPDGTRISFVPYPTPLQDDDGQLIGAVNVLIDVTDRRKAEDALIANAEALRGSNAVKDEFWGLVSHELRTPVTTIFGNAQVLRDKADTLGDGDRKSMISDIAEDSERLLGIIENLLLLTRLGSGTKPDVEPQVLNHVVRKAIDTFTRHHEGRRVTFLGVARLLIVDADRTNIELLIGNLLSNADKYSPASTDIDVVLQVKGREAQVLVLDRGIGLNEEETEALFAPFYRALTAKKQANGIGVGLAVCKRVIESHGGRIWAKPRDGGGSEFGFALPIGHERVDLD